MGLVLAATASSALSGARTVRTQWERLGFPQPASELTALAVGSRGRSTVYVGVRLRGVYKTTDGGRSWRYVGLRGERVWSLAVHPALPRVVYAGVSGKTGTGVATSRDAGKSWSETARCSEVDVLSFAFDPRDRQVVYAGGDGVWKSRDGGQTWTYPERTRGIGGSHVNGFSVVVRSPKTPGAGREALVLVYAAVGSGGGCGAGAPCGANGPSVPLVGGVFRSTDAGTSWRRAGLARTPVVDVAVEPRRPWIIYAAATTDATHTAPVRSGVYKSRNAGRTWHRSSTGLPLSSARWPNEVTSLVLDPVRAQTLYLGTAYGVYRSTDGARTWRAFNEGLGKTDVTELAISPDGSMLYAMSDAGLARRPLDLHAGRAVMQRQR